MTDLEGKDVAGTAVAVSKIDGDDEAHATGVAGEEKQLGKSCQSSPHVATTTTAENGIEGKGGDDADDDDHDPYIELEEIDGKVATNFVHFSNQMCLLGLGDPTVAGKKKNTIEEEKGEHESDQAGPTTTTFYDRILKSFEQQKINKIPLVSQFGVNPQTGEAELYNLWRDENVSFWVL